jgi:hypothetical protein
MRTTPFSFLAASVPEPLREPRLIPDHPAVSLAGSAEPLLELGPLMLPAIPSLRSSDSKGAIPVEAVSVYRAVAALAVAVEAVVVVAASAVALADAAAVREVPGSLAASLVTSADATSRFAVRLLSLS